MIDKRLILEFREKVNENDFVLFKYRKNQKKNQWNCICSAMDWIIVASDYMNREERDYTDSIEIYAYISSIDIIVEAIQQLHRVLFGTSKVLYLKARDIFTDNPFEQTDIDYFKTIRACFGAHPVNLKEPGAKSDSEERRFASWSGVDWESGKGYFSVILYSNQVDENKTENKTKDNIIINIAFEQLDAFLKKYYSHLKELMAEIDRQYTAYCLKMRDCSLHCEGDTLTQLRILQKENSQRLDNSYYRYTLDRLVLFFETPVTCADNEALVNQYLEILKLLVEEIKSNLQEMKLCDLKYGVLVHPQPSGLPATWTYLYEKFSNYDSAYPPNIWLSPMEKIFQDEFVFSYTTYNELYLLVHAALYRRLSRTAKWLLG